MASDFLQRSRHGTRLYFRRRVPGDLSNALSVRQMYRSLGTCDLRVGRTLARALAVYSDVIFERIREMKKRGASDEELRAALDREWGSWGDPGGASRSSPMPAGPLADSIPNATRPPNPQTAPGSIDVSGRSQLPVERPGVPSDDSEGIRVNYEVEVRGYDSDGRPLLSVKTTPGDRTDHDAAMSAVEAIAQAVLPRAKGTPSALQSGEASLRLKDGAELWALDRFQSAANSRSTVKAYTQIVEDVVLPDFGIDFPLENLTQARYTQFSDGLRSRFPKVTPSTRNHYRTVAVAMFRWLKGRGHTPVLVANIGLNEVIDSLAQDQRKELTLDQLAVIFQNVNRKRLKSPARFWVTIAVAILGCRLEELAQLDITRDFWHDEASDMWVISINRELDADGVSRKALKKGVPDRIVPVHPSLVRHGFIDFLVSQRAAGKSRPFESEWLPYFGPIGHSEDDGDEEDENPYELSLPDLARRPKWSQKISKWGGNQLTNMAKKHGWERKKLTYFHSMRHTMATELAEAGVPESLRSAYQGHKAQSAGMNEARYTKVGKRFVAMARDIFPHLQPYADLLDALPRPPAATPPKRPVGRPRKAP